jgi:hypothetical protein
VDPTNGQLLHSYHAGLSVYGAPAVLDGDMVAIAVSPNRVLFLAADGSLSATYTNPQPGKPDFFFFGGPIAIDAHTVAVGGGGEPDVYILVGDDGSEKARIRTAENNDEAGAGTPRPVCAPGRLYLPTNLDGTYVVDPTTRAQIAHWKQGGINLLALGNGTVVESAHLGDLNWMDSSGTVQTQLDLAGSAFSQLLPLGADRFITRLASIDSDAGDVLIFDSGGNQLLRYDNGLGTPTAVLPGGFIVTLDWLGNIRVLQAS